MEKLKAELEELSSKSKTCKMWVDIIIKPTFLLMLHDRSDHEGDFALHLYAAVRCSLLCLQRTSIIMPDKDCITSSL